MRHMSAGLLILLSFIFGPAARADAKRSCTAETNVLRTAQAIAQTIKRSEDRPTPFMLTGRVTCHWFSDDKQRVVLAVEDSSGAITMQGDRNVLGYHPVAGDLVSCKGTIHYARAHRMLAIVKQISRLGHDEPLPLASVSIGELLRGRHDFRFVRLSDVTVRDIRRSETCYTWALFTLCNGNATIYASYSIGTQDITNLEKYIGAHVSIDGVCSPLNIGVRRQLGRSFKAIGKDPIRILSGPERDVSELPDIKVVRNMPPDEILLQDRHRARGQILAVWNGNRALLRTEDRDTIGLRLAQTKDLRSGAFVEVIGFPETDLFHINMNHAVWRAITPLRLPEQKVQDVSAHDLLYDEQGHPKINGDYHGRILRICGQIQGLPSLMEGHGTFLLLNGSDTFPVPVNAETGSLPSLALGDLVEVTGVCVMEPEHWHPNANFPKLQGFSLVPRTPNDIRVLKGPPWWTPTRLLVVIGILFLVIIALIVRVAVRKRFHRAIAKAESDLKVHERTRLAVELHDSVAQNLTGVSMEIRAARRALEESPSRLTRHLDLAALSLDSCREELRNCLWDLRNLTLEERTVDEAIRKTLQQHIGNASLSVRFNVSREAFSDNMIHTVLRIVRELTINSVRHGKATDIKVAGSLDGNSLLFSVRDNGCGFDPDAVPGMEEGHFGLQGIRDRIDLFNGEMTIDSSPTSGTRTTIVLELPNDTESDTP